MATRGRPPILDQEKRKQILEETANATAAAGRDFGDSEFWGPKNLPRYPGGGLKGHKNEGKRR